MTETVTNRAFGLNKVNWEEYVIDSICNVELPTLYLAFNLFLFFFFFKDPFWKTERGNCNLQFKANVLRAIVRILFTNSKKKKVRR